MRAGTGTPVVVTVKLKGVPTMAVAEVELVIAGATAASVRVCEEVPATLSQLDSSPS